MRRSLAVLVALAALFGVLGAAATLNVPSQYPTIAAALAVANPGDTILVGNGYDGEQLPITITKNNITLKSNVNTTLKMDESFAGVVFKEVTGGRLEGFTITSKEGKTGDIGVVIKESTNVTVINNTVHGVLQGIRLIDSSYNTVRNNVVHSIGAKDNGVSLKNGIGIFVELCYDNTLRDNTVYDAGVGLMIFESSYISVTGGEYHDNTYAGVVINDTARSGLGNVDIYNNKGWGVFVVHSAENLIEGCRIYGNRIGGVELAGSSLNTVRGNYIYDNGTRNSGINPQLVITGGDKVIMTSDAFDIPNEIDHIRDKKHVVEWKVELLEGWMHDLNEELIEIEQKLHIAQNMAVLPVTDSRTTSLLRKIDEAIAEKNCIYQTDSYLIVDLSDSSHRPGFETDLTDPTKNFSIAGAGQYFARHIDSLYIGKTADGAVMGPYLGWYLFEGDDDDTDRYPLTVMKEFIFVAISQGIIPVPTNLDDLLKADAPDFPLPSGYESLTKMAIFEVLGYGIYYEVEEIIRQVENLSELQICPLDQEEILGKLYMILSKLESIGEVFFGEETESFRSIEGRLIALGIALNSARGEVQEATYGDAASLLGDALGHIDEIHGLKEDVLEFRGDLWWINRKLWEINEELPPEVSYNGELLAKKEKPGNVPISDCTIYGTGCEGYGLVGDLVTALNADDWAPRFPGRDFTRDDILVNHIGEEDYIESMDNVIDGNIFTTTVITEGQNVGLILESPRNTVVNNTFTNWDILNGTTEVVGTMDRAVLMMSSHNKVLYNAIVAVNYGIVRGGEHTRYDIQLTYMFKKLARAELDRGRVDRPITFVPVVLVDSAPVTITVTREVKFNIIALNLIGVTGRGVDIVKAESNTILYNMFFDNVNAAVYLGGVAVDIIIRHNDFVRGHSVVSVDTAGPQDAAQNYGFNSPVVGPVTPPAAEDPFCPTNFGTITKFELYGIGGHFAPAYKTLAPKAQSAQLRKLEVAGVEFNLPTDWPRKCGDLLDDVPITEPNDLEKAHPTGWNLVSVPVVPTNPAPTAVYDEIADLYLFHWDPTVAGNWRTVKNGLLTQVSVTGGYWMWLQDPVTIGVSGEDLTGQQVERALGAKGWKMIGVPYPVAWGHGEGGSIKVRLGAETKTLNQAVDAGWLYHTIWEWDAATQDWVKPTVAMGATLDPWLGYWIYTFEDNLELIFDPAGAPPGPPPTPTALAALGMQDPGNPPAPPAPVSFAADQIVVAGYPNPVQAGQVTFAVQGPMAMFAEALRVQVLDVSGRTVYQAENTGAQVNWGLVDRSGAPVANGVYLYVVEVKAQGQWVRTPVGRILVLR